MLISEINKTRRRTAEYPTRSATTTTAAIAETNAEKALFEKQMEPNGCCIRAADWERERRKNLQLVLECVRVCVYVMQVGFFARIFSVCLGFCSTFRMQKTQICGNAKKTEWERGRWYDKMEYSGFLCNCKSQSFSASIVDIRMRLLRYWAAGIVTRGSAETIGNWINMQGTKKERERERTTESKEKWMFHMIIRIILIFGHTFEWVQRKMQCWTKLENFACSFYLHRKMVHVCLLLLQQSFRFDDTDENYLRSSRYLCLVSAFLFFLFGFSAAVFPFRCGI